MFQRVISKHMQQVPLNVLFQKKSNIPTNVWHSLEIPRQKSKIDGNCKLFFLDQWSKFHFFLIDPWNFNMLFL